MKIICDSERLMEGIVKVQKAISTKSTLPILEGILIEAYDDLRLAGNDLDIAIECHINPVILDKGSIVVNARIFGDIISKMPKGEILIEVQESNSVYIESGNTHFRIKGLSAEGYPGLQPIDEGAEFSTESGIFRDMVRQTIFAASTDESQPVYTGMLVECKEQDFSIVAADRVARLAYRHSKILNNGVDFETIIPARTLKIAAFMS